MDDWVLRAMARWPNVPALFGWLRLGRRGRWLIQDQVITRPRIIEVINRNYAQDGRGRWYFQNGPQRGYIALDYAPFILRSDGEQALVTHTGVKVTTARCAYLDEQGSLMLDTAVGAGLISDRDLDWVLLRLTSPRLTSSGLTGQGNAQDQPVTETQLMAALERPDGDDTGLQFRFLGQSLPVRRCDFDKQPKYLGFVREPRPANDTESNGS